MWTLTTRLESSGRYAICMEDQRTRIINEITKVLDDPKLATLTNEEKSVAVYDEVLKSEFDRLADAWVRLMYTNPRDDPN